MCSNTMKTLNINEMAVGDEIVLLAEKVAGIRFIKVDDTAPSKEGVESRPYAQVAYGPISFTINEKEDIDQVATREGREEIGEFCMQVTEYDQPALDADGNEQEAADGSTIMIKRRGLTFMYLRTWDGIEKLENRKGKVAAIKQKYAAPVAATVTAPAVEA